MVCHGSRDGTSTVRQGRAISAKGAGRTWDEFVCGPRLAMESKPGRSWRYLKFSSGEGGQDGVREEKRGGGGGADGDERERRGAGKGTRADGSGGSWGTSEEGSAMPRMLTGEGGPVDGTACGSVTVDDVAALDHKLWQT